MNWIIKLSFNNVRSDPRVKNRPILSAWIWSRKFDYIRTLTITIRPGGVAALVVPFLLN